MTPRNEARAYRIWALGNALKWECTQEEIADELGLHRQMVYRICKAKGWKTSGTVMGDPNRRGVDQVINSRFMQGRER
jgi:DNA-binding transcriptional regulator LsrR (DeoR family)